MRHLHMSVTRYEGVLFAHLVSRNIILHIIWMRSVARWNPPSTNEELNWIWEACTYDVRKIFGFLDPLPPCLNFALTYSIEFTQPPIPHLLLAQPLLPPQCGRHMYIALSLVSFSADSDRVRSLAQRVHRERRAKNGPVAWRDSLEGP